MFGLITKKVTALNEKWQAGTQYAMVQCLQKVE